MSHSLNEMKYNSLCYFIKFITNKTLLVKIHDRTRLVQLHYKGHVLCHYSAKAVKERIYEIKIGPDKMSDEPQIEFEYAIRNTNHMN